MGKNAFKFFLLKETAEAFIAPEDFLSKEHWLAAMSLFTKRPSPKPSGLNLKRAEDPQPPPKTKSNARDVDIPEIRTASGKLNWLKE